MTTSQEQLKQYTFHVEYKSYSNRSPIKAELTYSTIQPDPQSAIDALLKRFSDKIILNVTPEKPTSDFNKITIPIQHKDWKNPRVFVGLPGKEPLVTKKVIERFDGTKTVVTSKREYTRAELMELLMRLEVL